MTEAPRRTWTCGVVHVGGNRPARRLASMVREHAAGEQIRVDLQPTSADAASITLAGIAVWEDPVAGKVTAGLVLRDGSSGECEWGLAAVAENSWSHKATSPAVTLGLVDLECRDPSGLPMTGLPEPLLVDRVRDVPASLETMIAPISSPERTVGLLIVAVSPHLPVARLFTAPRWPGLINLMLVSDDGRDVLAEALPKRPIPPGGARLFTASADGVDDLCLSKNALRRPGTLVQLHAEAAAARDRSTPVGLTRDAAALLDGFHEAPLTSPSSAAHDELEELRRRVADLDGQLREARTGMRDKDKQLRTVAIERDTARCQVTDLRARLDATTDAEALRRHACDERDLLQRLLEQAEEERDDAVHELGLARFLAAPTHSQTPAAVAGEPGSIPDTFAHLLKESRQHHSLLIFDFLDDRLAAELDAYPGAKRWRRKTFGTLTTMNAYAAAKAEARRTDQPPGARLANLRAYAGSGFSCSLISANTIALSESDAVKANPRYREARTFPVHPETSPRGKAHFWAHVRIAEGPPPAPRLHFYDDTDGPTGSVYIGYLGQHLPSGRTN